MKSMIKLPYGESFLNLELADGTYKLVKSRVSELKSQKEGIDIVGEAMKHPYGSKTLKELAKGKRNAVLIISDHTRPVPSKDIIPLMLEEMRLGNPDIDITFLVATGCHRGTTKSELMNKLGEDIVKDEKIIIHDCINSEFVEKGILPSGAKCIINKIACDTDLLVAEGFIEPHFFAGYSGGRKSVFPGVCALETVLGNHCSAFIDSPYARAGILDKNPIHTDMMQAAKIMNLAYIVNVVIGENKETVAAFAGDMAQAHIEGCKFLEQYCHVDREPADIVLVTNSGAPLDQNVYQSVKGLSAAEATAKKGAVLIMCAELADGSGSEDLYLALKNCKTPRDLYREIQKIPQEETKLDQWEYQILARIMMNHKVIFVTEKENQKMIEDMKILYAPNPGVALKMAREIKGKQASLTVIPDGMSVVFRA